jgi:phage tail P2-like protein
MIKAMPPLTPEQIQPGDQGLLLTDIGVLDLLPPVLAGDESMRAVARAVDAEIRRIDERIKSALIWAALNELTEPMLSHLAAWMHVDWWDEDWTLEAKRAFIFWQVPIHRKKGTCWAVEEAVSLVYGQAFVREWFEYGGEPGWFRLEVDVRDSGLTKFQIEKIEIMVETYKRKSQHMDGLTFSTGAACTIYIGAACLTDEVLTIYPYYPTELEQAQAAIYSAAALDVLETFTISPL